MVEFAGWEMPLRYEGSDASKIAGGPGAAFTVSTGRCISSG